MKNTDSLIRQLEESVNKPVITDVIRTRASVVASVKAGEVVYKAAVHKLSARDFPVRGDYAIYCGKVAAAYRDVTTYITAALSEKPITISRDRGDGYPVQVSPRTIAIESLQSVIDYVCGLSGTPTYTVKKSDLAYVCEVMIRHGKKAIGGDETLMKIATQAAEKYGKALENAQKLEADAIAGTEKQETADIAKQEAARALLSATTKAAEVVVDMSVDFRREFVSVESFRDITEDCIMHRLNGTLPKVKFRPGTVEKLDKMDKSAKEAVTPEKVEAKKQAEQAIAERAAIRKQREEEQAAEERQKKAEEVAKAKKAA